MKVTLVGYPQHNLVELYLDGSLIGITFHYTEAERLHQLMRALERRGVLEVERRADGDGDQGEVVL